MRLAVVSSVAATVRLWASGQQLKRASERTTTLISQTTVQKYITLFVSTELSSSCMTFVQEMHIARVAASGYYFRFIRVQPAVVAPETRLQCWSVIPTRVPIDMFVVEIIPIAMEYHTCHLGPYIEPVSERF